MVFMGRQLTDWLIYKDWIIVMDELILVDLYDNETGHMEKADVHRLGKLHRAFSVFIVNDGKMLIQRRNRNKYHSGGLWANACCSHPRMGETLHEATSRRLREELGISCNIEEVFAFVYFSKYSDELFEYEYDHVFLGAYSEKFNFNRDEIEELRWVSFAELEREMISEPEKFASWFMIAAPKVLSILSNKKGF